MARSSKFASAKYAWGLCDTCGFRYPLLSLQEQTVMGHRQGILSCPTCNDPDHPQNFLPRYVTTDAQALRNARPDTGMWQSRILTLPGNWINGQRPTPEWLDKWAQEIEAERDRQRANWRMEMEAQRLRQRSF